MRACAQVLGAVQGRCLPGLEDHVLGLLIKALEDGLADDQRFDARMELTRKIDIVAAGAKKRGRVEELARLGALRARYEDRNDRVEETLS